MLKFFLRRLGAGFFLGFLSVLILGPQGVRVDTPSAPKAPRHENAHFLARSTQNRPPGGGLCLQVPPFFPWGFVKEENPWSGTISNRTPHGPLPHHAIPRIQSLLSRRGGGQGGEGVSDPPHHHLHAKGIPRLKRGVGSGPKKTKKYRNGKEGQKSKV